MADDFNDWIDGEPITGPSSDGSFTEWVDGEPVIRYEDSATLLVIPDAAHLHTASGLDYLVEYVVHTLTNPGGETGDTTGWTNETGDIGVRSSTPSPHTGSYYFDAGANLDTLASQEVDLAGDGVSTTEIDAEILTFVFGGYCASYVEDDQGALQVRFKDAAKDTIETHAIALWAVAPNQTWKPREVSATIPATTRYVDVIIQAHRTAGTNNDAYFDDLYAYTYEQVQYQTGALDFSSDAVGTQPAGWSEGWDTGNDVSNLITTGGNYGDNLLRIACGTVLNARHYFSYDEFVRRYPGGARDVDMYALVRANTSDDHMLRVGARIFGDATESYVTWAGLQLSSDNLIQHCYMGDGGSTNITTGAMTLNTATWYWVRLQLNGVTARTKVWTGSIDDEPGSWTQQGTVYSTKPGAVGFLNAGDSGDSYDVDICYLAAGGSEAYVGPVIPDAYHLHDAENLTITTDAATDLVIPDAYHLHDAENLTITTDAATDLVIPDAYHLVTDTNRAIEIVPAEDTYVDQRATTTPRGADTFCMNKNYTGYQRYSLLRIDLGDIPLAADITSVTLKTYQFSIDVDPDSITLNIYKCLKAWVENEATWNVYSTGNSWDTAGALNSTTDYDGSTLFSTITFTTPDPGENSLWEFPTSDNFVNYIDSVIGGEANLIVHADVSHYGIYTFHSKESAVSAYWPVLYVRYVDATPMALTQAHDLVVAEAYNEIIDDGPIAIQTGLTLVMAEAYHDLVDEGPLALIQEHALTVAECDHLHEADSIVLTALHILTVAECYHVHAPPNLTLTTLTALTVQESHHLHVSDNISLGYQPTLSGLDSYHVLADDFDYLRSPDTTLVLVENGVAGPQFSGRSAGTYRMPFNVTAAFPQHGKIRFQISAASDDSSTLVSASYGYRASGDTTTDTPTALTFSSVSLPYTMSPGETFWSDWMDFNAATASEILVSLWFNATHYPAEWSDGRTRYWGTSGNGDQTLTVNMTTWLTQSNTWYIRSIEVTEGALVIDSASHVTTSDNIDFNQHFLTTAETYHTMASDSVELSLTAWVNEEPWVYDTSAAARNYRMIMPASILDYEGQYVRVKIECHDTDSVSMDGMSIGRRKAAADAFDYDDSTVTPVRFTFDGGSNAVVVGAGESKWSDWVPFSLNPSLDHLIHCHLDGPHKFAYNTVLDCYRKNASTDETMISDVKSYTLVDEFFYLVKLEVRVRSVMAGFDDAVHLHTADNLALGVHLTVDDAFHLHEADAIPALTGTHNLTLAACDHLHDTDALTLTQEHTLALADDTLLHEADTLNLAGTNILVVAESDHLHTADAANLIVTLGVDETYHEHTAPNLTLVSGFDLVVADDAILTVSDNIAGMTVSMTVASSYHDHLADALAITADHFLTTAETYHLHTADSLNTYMTGDLPIQSAHHEIESDELTLGFSVTLTVREAYHRHFVDTLALTQEHTLAMPDGDSYHDHFADNIDIPALPEGLERTFINSLTVQRTMWSLTRRLTIEGRAA